MAFAVAFLGGVFGLAWALGPDNPSAKSCFETEYEFDEEARIDPLLREKRFRHLAYDYVSCKDGCDDEGDASSCRTVAIVYADGKGLRYEGEVDMAKAEEYATKACELDGKASCPGAERYRCLADPSACEERCRDGDGADCVTLARGIDVIGAKGYDPERAVELHGRACRSGVEDSCAKERRLLCASRPVDCAERCKAGEAPLCWDLGDLFSRGLGEVAKNPSKGMGFQKKACELDAKVDASCGKILNDAKIEL